MPKRQLLLSFMRNIEIEKTMNTMEENVNESTILFCITLYIIYTGQQNLFFVLNMGFT